MIYRILSVFIIFQTFFITISSAQLEYRKRIVKTYRINNSTTIDVANKYGKVLVVLWDRDSVQFEVNLKIRSTNEVKLKKIKNTIDFEFTGTEYYVIAKTIIGDNSVNMLRDLKDLAESFISNDNKVTINYIVRIPDYANLKIDNKFGDVFIDDLNGNLNLSLSNGQLKANNLLGNTIINLNSADALINSIKDGKINIAYSDFDLNTSDKIIIDSRSSKITIDQADFMKATSRRDQYYLGKINKMYGSGDFSNFTLQNLKHELSLSLKFGLLSLDYIENAFSSININDEYADLDLIFERGSNYSAEITHHEDASINYPNQIYNLDDTVINKDQKLYMLSGKIGSGPANSKLKINAPKKCIINIMHK